MNAMSTTDDRGGAFGQADVLDLAFLYELLHLRHGNFDGSVGIDAMQVKQIQAVDIQSAQRILALPPNEVRGAVRDDMERGNEPKLDARFRGDDNVLAGDLVEGVADDLFLTDDRGRETEKTPGVDKDVQVGGVPESDAVGVDFLEEGDDFVVGKFCAVGGGETHAAVTHAGDHQTLGT